VQDKETAMTVDSERMSWFICSNMCYYNCYADTKEQKLEKKMKKKRHLEHDETMPVDKGQSKYCRKVEAERTWL
jgi:hypothetical protein